eukprot:643020-Hanusia_phi.AAC.2
MPRVSAYPCYRSWTTLARNMFVDDDPVLRSLPYFGEQDEGPLEFFERGSKKVSLNQRCKDSDLCHRVCFRKLIDMVMKEYEVDVFLRTLHNHETGTDLVSPLRIFRKAKTAQTNNKG